MTSRFMVKRRAGRLVSAAAALTLISIPSNARADVVLDWNATMVNTLAGVNPFATARYAAITQLAVFEAVSAITGQYEPYLAPGTIVAPAGASAEAAAATAAYTVLLNYFPAADFPAKAAALDSALTSSLAAIPDGPAKTAGIAAGQAAAAALIALRANDGSASEDFYLPAATAPGQWQATPSCAASAGLGQFYHWRNVTPFGVPAIADFRLGPPPALGGGTYGHDYIEVKSVGAADSVLRAQDRTDVARFYARTSPAAWANSAARQAAAAQGRSLSENARAFALLNMAISDGGVAAFDTKYHYTTWRPETAIHAGDADGNDSTIADLAFVPLITAPCFPSYPSAHASVSYAAREVLDRLYGASQHDIVLSNPAVPGVLLQYTEFKRIVEDIDDARVFGGIHFGFDQEAGARQGRSLGAAIFKSNLRPVQP